ELKTALLGVFGTIGVEVVVEQDRYLARDDTRIRCLLRHDRVVLAQLLEEVDGGLKIRGSSAEREIDGDRTDIADRSRRRIEVTDHSLVVRLQKILPAGWHWLAAQRVLVHEQAKRTGVNGGPVTVRVLQAGRHPIPVHGL